MQSKASAHDENLYKKRFDNNPKLETGPLRKATVAYSIGAAVISAQVMAAIRKITRPAKNRTHAIDESTGKF